MERPDDQKVIQAAMRVVEAARVVLTPPDGDDPPPDDEWAPEFIRLRDALAAYDTAIEARRAILAERR
jgi:hypothetical protein